MGEVLAVSPGTEASEANPLPEVSESRVVGGKSGDASSDFLNPSGGSISYLNSTFLGPNAAQDGSGQLLCLGGHLAQNAGIK